ncbi:MAG TPA: glycosyltransferase 87 family protein [Vicinamibacteria bacterium]|nr:glycosyltransferase 87 family protein [Vicinamibacteria bacterium]
MPEWIAPWLPRPGSGLDRDPIALVLGAVATGLALVYLALATFGARPRLRAAVIAAASAALVVGPSLAFVAMGRWMDRPYGQDGGVVQIPLALDKILAGQSPYGADYSDSILGKEARVSRFWEAFGGNPILHHHAYLPGTHLVMMPFYLAGRALFGFFDPRLVTLLAYGLAVWLAVGYAEGASARLAAAALVALNPLAYWHQIFGANDIIFVALILGAVRLARADRPLLCALALGFACATKQLAWPFAPFLLVHLSGARDWRGLGSRSALLRMARPAAVATLVFVAVVAPVAALDLRAFYRDIFVYNVGLPGGDNYPLGGTPGFGFANFLIYFGRVASLRDYFPFSLFYLLLVPWGLLLLHVQLRRGGAATALITGSGALLASLYFSRVVHPNYLIPVAVLLPLAFLVLRREADVAAVPLLLLALAVEMAEHAVFRTTWEDAVAGGLPLRLKGLCAILAPRAGIHLTADPLGLLLSATAAGLALVYLLLFALGASARLRAGLVVLAVVSVVVVPTLVVISVGRWTGTPRAQDDWVVRVASDAQRLTHGRSPFADAPPAGSGAGREAWTTSFRMDPPGALVPEDPVLPPGSTTLAALVAGTRDPRIITLLALGLLMALAAGLGRPAERPLALALAGLAPPLALGTVFGSPAALPLVALLGSLALATGGRAFLAGAVAGAAGALDHRAWLGVPFLLAPLARGGRVLWPRALGGVVAGYLVLVLPTVLPDAGAFAAAMWAEGGVGPGLGLANLFLYWGAPDGTLALAVFALAPLAAVLAMGALLLASRGEPSPLALAGLAVGLGLFLSRGVSAEAVALPLVLLAFSALAEA